MVEEVKQAGNDQPRLQHLKSYELQVQEQMASSKSYQQEAPAEYSEEFEVKNATKYLATFPYPYMNGFLHMGHAYSMSKAEFMTRYQRQIGKRALFPFGFHCTGMPISSAAIRLQREISNEKTRSNQPDEPLTQYEILMQIGIAEADIPAFQDPSHWLDFFPPLGQKDLQRFGVHVDWRRSFITTDKNPFYDQFIRWQYSHLKANNKIKFGKRYTIYSESERQPCADHDRGSGEGVGPQEYTGIKIRLLDFPESLAQFKDRNVFLVAGTLRPETMYGQTNCFVLPDGDYGLFEMRNDDIFIITERAARHFAFQEMTKVDFEYPSLVNIKGQELIGMKVKAPMTKYDHVYVLPLPSISMTKGTAVVTSVPSDSPADFAMLRDLQTKEGLREKMGIKEEWVAGFDPIPLIEVPGMGNICAKHAVEELKIQSHKDAAKLEQAKEKCYNEGFYKGVMLMGIGEGQKVEVAKPLVKQQMIDEGNAVPYYEPEKEVTARTGESCIVALCDQWLLNYGEENWKNAVKEHVLSDDFDCFNPKTDHEFVGTLDWLKEWGCSRTTGLGTRVPWDEQFVIESLSDSTIYTAYYTISHLLQGDNNLEGTSQGPLDISASAMTVEAFDYVFLGKPYNAEKCPDVTEEQLAKLKHEFEYWYPMDLGVSGKDLIRNHLTMAMYNHQAIWQDPKKMTRHLFCNGYLCLNNQKMSKSTGNFMTLSQCMDKFGADATRLALADAGDLLDDANFDEKVANACIMDLFVLDSWIEKHFTKEPLDFSADDRSTYSLWDNLMSNEINRALKEAKQDYDTMKYKNIVRLFHNMLKVKENYLIAKNNEKNPFVIARFVEAILTILNPIVPHFAQSVWDKHVLPMLKQSSNMARAPADLLMDNNWPEMGAINPMMTTQMKYLTTLKSEIRISLDKSMQGGKKKKGAAATPAAAKENCIVAIGSSFPEQQIQILEILQNQPWEGNTIKGDFVTAVRTAIPDKKKQGLAMKFAAFVVKEAIDIGAEQALMSTSPFDEQELIVSNQVFLFENMGSLKNTSVVKKEDESIDAVASARQVADSAVPGKPSIIFH